MPITNHTIESSVQANGLNEKLLLAQAARIRELVSSGLLDENDGAFQIHDYLKHQMSAAEVTAYKKARRADGSFGAQVRHHVRDKKPNDGCSHCVKEGLIPRDAA